jgi:hypothetical protein
MGTEPARWQAAARQLQKQAPPIAALALALVEELANWEQRLRQQRKPSTALPAVGQAPRAKRGSNWAAIVIVVVVINVVRLALTGSGGSSYPKYDVPPYPAMKNDDETQRILREALKPRTIRVSPDLRKALEKLKQEKKDAGRPDQPPQKGKDLDGEPP